MKIMAEYLVNFKRFKAACLALKKKQLRNYDCER